MSTQNEIFIIGAGGHARVVVPLARACGYEVKGVIDNGKPNFGEEILRAPILGGMEVLDTLEAGSKVTIALGDNFTRATIFKICQEKCLTLPALIHPSANVDEGVEIGEGAQICMGASLVAAAQIGRNVIINTNSSVDHESIIEEHANICPGVNIGGRSEVKRFSFIGIGATIINHIIIGENCVVGAGCVIINDLQPDGLYVGVPAQRKKDREKIAGP